MKSLKAFKVNNYITLKLEEGKTNIYIKDKYFRQCKYLLLNISPKEINYIEDIESIDEAAEKLSHSMEREEGIIVGIRPEEEFWGHCSNLQVWVEHNYNTCLLKSELAFSLLKTLANVGDIKARQVLKEEIVKRIIAGYLPVTFYLITEKYPERYLNEEEMTLITFKKNNKLKRATKSSVIDDIKNKKKGSMALQILEAIIKDYGDRGAKKLYMDIIHEILRLKKKDDFNYLRDEHIQIEKLLSEDELEELLYSSPIFLRIIGDNTEIEETYKKIISRLDKNKRKELLMWLIYALNYPEDIWSIADAIDEIFIDYQHGRKPKLNASWFIQRFPDEFGLKS